MSVTRQYTRRASGSQHAHFVGFLVSLCAMLLGGGMAYGATFGNTSSGTTYNHSIEDVVRGTQFNLAEAGVATSITAYLTIGTSATLVRCMIYDAVDSSLIAVTEMKSVPVQTATATTFNFNYTVNLAADDYFLAASALAGGGTAFLGRNFAGGGDQSFEDADAFASYPDDPYVSSSAYNTYLYRIYCTYTAGTQSVFGDATIQPTNLSCKQTVVGGAFTSPAGSNQITSVTPHLVIQSAAGEDDTVKCALYLESSLALIDTTYQIVFDGDTAVSGAIRLWREFTFPSPIVPTASTKYVLAVWGAHFSTSINTRVVTSGGENVEVDVETFDGSFPDPLDGGTTLTSYKLSMFADYEDAPAGGGTFKRRIEQQRIIRSQLWRDATRTFAENKNEIAD